METKLAVTYIGGAYRVHAAGCADLGRRNGFGELPHVTGEYAIADGIAAASDVATSPVTAVCSALETIIARDQFSDFIAEDPDYYTPETVLADWSSTAKWNECAIRAVREALAATRGK